jgi:hypothetical protein
VLDGITDAARRSNLRIVWRQVDGDPVALVTLAPTAGGRRIVRIDTIRLEEGQLVVAGTTDAAR